MSAPTYPVLFVGAGPGDPELITVAGRRALEEADLVVYAGSLVPERMLSWCQDQAQKISSAGLHLDEIISTMLDAWKAGQKVVRLQTGDISLFGALAEQAARLNQAGVPWKVIPGVTAAFAAAAALGLEYTLPEVTQSLIITRVAGRTPVPEAENIRAMAAHGCSLAIYLSAGQAQKISHALETTMGPDAPVAVVMRASWPDQKILWTTAAKLPAGLKQAGINRQALIMAGPAVAALATGEAAPQSKLYHASFTHGWREGEEE